ncbi:hypothetical protein BRADI_2g55292v3 [Brachypodium distachyon]|uniref:Uncharacterized protein n=1 Tax=Brachypodium distachyon TaxID=15368 RepID=A0A2K2DG02_BRADI|nr:hypothetical protein BRADI_2g55292v3 [Brachypodium distachyon]
MLLCGCALQFFPPPPRRRRPHPPRSATAANLAEARPVFGTADIKVYRRYVYYNSFSRSLTVILLNLCCSFLMTVLKCFYAPLVVAFSFLTTSICLVSLS